MKHLLIQRAAMAPDSHEEAARLMFRHGFLAAGGEPSCLTERMMEEAVIEVMTFAAVHPDGPHKRAFIMDRASSYGRQCAQVLLYGEVWAVDQDLGWHASLLRRHGIAVRG